MVAPSHILVIRFSAMGDVAMTIPVLRNLLHRHPNLRITVVSNAFLQPLFAGLDRCIFYPAYLKGKHAGFAGMLRLFTELLALGPFDGVADLHNVLRSRLLGMLFSLKMIKVERVDKGRKEKRALTRKENKVCKQLTPMHERYLSVFRKMGIEVPADTSSKLYDTQPVPPALQSVFSSGKKVVGVAPFAQYKEKMYPLEKMKAVVQQLAASNKMVLLVGGGKDEAALLQQWEQEIFSVFNIAGRYSLADELAIISNLDLMVSMDSANMHLASLYNVPVVSVWGATHPFAGFYGWSQSPVNIAQIDLYCRPCSVFGNKPCYRGDHACMNLLPETLVLEKINHVLGA